MRCSGELFPADCFFHFTISQRSPLLQQSIYSDYQYFLYETISELRDKQMTFNQIAEELNKKGYLSARGKVTKLFIRNASLQKHLLYQSVGSKKVNKINVLFDSIVCSV